jgi:hypothetical protein
VLARLAAIWAERLARAQTKSRCTEMINRLRDVFHTSREQCDCWRNTAGDVAGFLRAREDRRIGSPFSWITQSFVCVPEEQRLSHDLA